MHQLSYFFRHYDDIVQHYFILDDGSDDGTFEALSAKPNVTLLQEMTVVENSFVLEGLAWSNSIWKRSRGTADWVIIVDMDEHLFHPDLRQYLFHQQKLGVTAIPALGMQMVSRVPPPDGIKLATWLQHGAPWIQMSKLAAFRPDAIDETDFTVGRHTANPSGRVQWPEQDELVLLHYKYLGFERTAARHAAANLRRRSMDLEMNWGHRYAFDAEKLEADFQEFEGRALHIQNLTNPHLDHREPRWWRKPAVSNQESPGLKDTTSDDEPKQT